VEAFLSKHANDVIGVLSGFDRLVFRGTLRMLAHHLGMQRYLWAMQVLLKDFASHAEAVTQQLRKASEAQARNTGRPILYLPSSAISKEDCARAIARQDGIEQGLICILTAVEPCLSYDIIRDREAKHLHLRPRHRRCLHLYHYQIHPIFGFMHARIQTWFPFAIQICLNGREWLARSHALGPSSRGMDAAGPGYVRRDNCFTRLEDPVAAQKLMDRQVQSAWPDLLNGIAQSLNPQHAAMFQAFPVHYDWSTYQSEWATDILFRNSARLARLYPRLVQHGLTSFLSPDVMRFLGRAIPPSGKLPPHLNAEVVSDVKRRHEGVRIKHRLGENSIKMYDKQASVLRVETTINDAAGFKSFRTPEGKPEAPQGWHGMRQGIADLHRRTQVSQAANDRYLQALASVENTTSLGELTARLCRPTKRNGRQVRPLNPLAPADAALIEALGRGEFSINGFRNRDLRQPLFTGASVSKAERRRRAAVVSRKLALLRAHRLIRKVPHTHRYLLTDAGRIAVTALITARRVSTPELTKLAA
jgi:hypothetical protein